MTRLADRRQTFFIIKSMLLPIGVGTIQSDELCSHLIGTTVNKGFVHSFLFGVIILTMRPISRLLLPLLFIVLHALLTGAEVILRTEECVVSVEGAPTAPTINVISIDERAFSQYAATGKPTVDEVKEFFKHSPCGRSLGEAFEENTKALSDHFN